MTKTVETPNPTQNWVPLVEGARMIARLEGEAPWPKQIRAAAGAKLLEALRSGYIASRGHSEISERQEHIFAIAWQSMFADIDNNCLTSMTPPRRPYPRVGFFDVEVVLADIQRIFGAAVKS